MDVSIHCLLRPSLVDFAQDFLNECYGMERNIAIRNPLTVIKLSCYVAGRIVRIVEKPIQRYIIPFETTIGHGLDAPPFYHPLDIRGSKILHEFNKLGRIHLFVFELVIMIMLWLILTRSNNGRIKQSEPLIQLYLR